MPTMKPFLGSPAFVGPDTFVGRVNFQWPLALIVAGYFPARPAAQVAEQADENGDDGDDHQELDQSKGAASLTTR